MSHFTTIIWNPNSGSAPACAELLRELRGKPNVDLVESESRTHAQLLAREATRNSDLIIAAGGDGSVNAIVDALSSQETESVTFGVLPLGSGNDLARNLNMPLEPRLAIERLLHADPAQDTIMLDLVEAAFDGESFTYANMATGGNSSDVLNLLEDEVKQRWGPLCYLRGAVNVMSDLQVYTTNVSIDDEDFTDLPLLNILVANGCRTGGGLNVAPHAKLDDGLLDVLLILDGTPIDIAALSAQLLISDYTQNDLVIWRQARNIRVDSNPGMRWTTDGEPVHPTNESPGSASSNFEVSAKKLRVVVWEASASS
ncbi:MAG: diacylglycerol kinase (ATP) [Planctomycetaceae bacterium]